jgi:predicted nuclease of predicted toxin-antitoxin system
VANGQLGFYIDEDLPPAIAKLLGGHGFEATSVLEEGRAELSDKEQLCFAAQQKLVLVTANIADYAGLARQWAARGRAHVGLVFVPTKRFPRRQAARITRALRALANQETPTQLRNSARFLAKA